MRHFTKFVSIVSVILSGSALITVFQNCGSFDYSAENPLHGSNISSFCIGINCATDVNMSRIVAPFNALQVDAPTNGIPSGCTSANCIDLGGYCETGGYPQSVFIFQWLLTGQPPGVETRSTETCDDNGRFHLQVQFPATYDWTKENQLRIFMKVIDETGKEYVSATGANAAIYNIKTRM